MDCNLYCICLCRQQKASFSSFEEGKWVRPRMGKICRWAGATGRARGTIFILFLAMETEQLHQHEQESQHYLHTIICAVSHINTPLFMDENPIHNRDSKQWNKGSNPGSLALELGLSITPRCWLCKWNGESQEASWCCPKTGHVVDTKKLQWANGIKAELRTGTSNTGNCSFSRNKGVISPSLKTPSCPPGYHPRPSRHHSHRHHHAHVQDLLCCVSFCVVQHLGWGQEDIKTKPSTTVKYHRHPLPSWSALSQCGLQTKSSNEKEVQRVSFAGRGWCRLME